jgi:DNA-binding GntR family transcriptional regulator
MWKELMLENLLEYHQGKGFFVKKENHFCHFFKFDLERIDMSCESANILMV